jgi:K+-transporting ATPase ATPase C chain
MFNSLPKELWIAIRVTVAIALIGGLLYPLAMTGVDQLAFHSNANGSLVTDRSGTVVGATQIGQCYYRTTRDTSGNLVFATTKDDKGNAVFVIDQRYFQGRPSFTVDGNGNPLPCNAANSAGSNLGPSNRALITRIQGYADYLHSVGIARNPDGSNAPIPIDLVTGDFTGFDPDITEAGALAQVDMVAAARHLDPVRVRQLAQRHLDGRLLGIFGEPHVNVLMLNLALDHGDAG